MRVLRLTSVQANQGIGEEFQFIIAAVIGGCLLTGGYGSAVGAAIGALIFGMAKQGIVFAGWDSDWFQLFLGVLLLSATLLNHYVRRRAESKV
jgi:simple sugar transport system permease protein